VGKTVEQAANKVAFLGGHRSISFWRHDSALRRSYRHRAWPKNVAVVPW